MHLGNRYKDCFQMDRNTMIVAVVAIVAVAVVASLIIINQAPSAPEPLPEPYCGDGNCDPDEDCSFCLPDCGVCPPVCGDATCDSDENCSTCAQDCGECPLPENVTEPTNVTQVSLTLLEETGCQDVDRRYTNKTYYTCISDFAANNSNSTHCSLINASDSYSMESRVNCHVGVASKTRNPLDCDIPNEFWDSGGFRCIDNIFYTIVDYTTLATQYTNPEKCLPLKNNLSRDSCLRTLTYETGNYTLCNEINSTYYRCRCNYYGCLAGFEDNCEYAIDCFLSLQASGENVDNNIDEMAVNRSRPDYCLRITSEEPVENCLLFAMLRSNISSDDCDILMPQGDYRRFCHAMLIEDYDCDGIIDPSLRERCQSYED